MANNIQAFCRCFFYKLLVLQLKNNFYNNFHNKFQNNNYNEDITNNI